MQIDLENVIKTFDYALTSEDPQVKQAVSTLVMMVALTRDPDGDVDGPFRTMWDVVGELRKENRKMREDIARLRHDFEMLTTKGSMIRGHSIDHAWIDESSTLPNSTWLELMKKVTVK